MAPGDREDEDPGNDDHSPLDDDLIEDDDLVDENDLVEDDEPEEEFPEEDEPRYESDIMRAKRQHGMAGAILAGGMFAIDEALGRKPKEQPAAVQEFAGEPTDIDAQGITIAVDEHTTVVSPAPHVRNGPARIVRRRRRGGQSESVE